MHMLVVEGERKVANFIRQALQEEGHATELASDGDTALALLLAGITYDLVVLDLQLTKCDGFSVLKTTRKHGVKTPVLAVSARDSMADKVAGLDFGADDYLTKPFALEEFLARVRALLRRGAPQGPPLLGVGDLALDPATHAVTRGNRSIRLTAREYSLLEYFLRNAGRVLTRVMIAQHVWGLNFDCESNIIDVYVAYLRRKIGAKGSAPLLHSVRGVGYVLKARAKQAPATRRRANALRASY